MSKAELNSQSYRYGGTTINGKPLGGAIELTASDVGASYHPSLDNFRKMDLNGTFVDNIWYKIITVRMPQSAGAMKVEYVGGNGYNIGIVESFQNCEIIIRTGNANPKGLNIAVNDGLSPMIKDIGYVNTSGDEYDIYASFVSIFNQGGYFVGQCHNNTNFDFKIEPTNSTTAPDGIVPGFFFGRPHPLVLVNGWKAYGGGFAPPHFVRKGNMVYLGGLVKHDTGTTTGAVAELPVWARPLSNHIFNQLCSGGHTRVDVSTSAVNVVEGYSGATPGIWTSLDGMSFSVNVL